MSIFSKAPLPNIDAPTIGANRDSLTGEIKVNDTFTSLDGYHVNFYKYLDRTGNTFPDLINTGLESEYIAQGGVKSINLAPTMGSGGFKSASGFTDIPENGSMVLISDTLIINAPVANTKVLWNFNWTFYYSNPGVTGNSEIGVYFKRGSTTGDFSITGGVDLISRTIIRKLQTGSADQSDASSMFLDTLPTAGNWYYKFTALKTGANIGNITAKSVDKDCRYSYLVTL